MKKVIYLLVASLFMTMEMALAQENSAKEKANTARVAAQIAKQQAKKAEKEAQEAEEQALYEAAKQAINAQNFVLEADRVEFKRGKFVYVTPTTNFVSLIDGKATIQLAFNVPSGGPNGIGGITVEGNPSNIKMETDKKGNSTFSMMVQGVGVSATVSIRLVEGSAKCTATVMPNFNGNRISFTGTLYPCEESNVYKGRPL